MVRVSVNTACKWRGRFAAWGLEGLKDAKPYRWTYDGTPLKAA
jgi:hypothetical protein